MLFGRRPIVLALGVFGLNGCHVGPPSTREPGELYGVAEETVRTVEYRTRRLSNAEVEQLAQTAEDGVLRIQSVVAHVDGPIDPIQWRVYPHCGDHGSVVLVDPREPEWSWETDIPKRSLEVLRAGCDAK